MEHLPLLLCSSFAFLISTSITRLHSACNWIACSTALSLSLLIFKSSEQAFTAISASKQLNPQTVNVQSFAPEICPNVSPICVLIIRQNIFNSSFCTYFLLKLIPKKMNVLTDAVCQDSGEWLSKSYRHFCGGCTCERKSHISKNEPLLQLGRKLCKQRHP